MRKDCNTSSLVGLGQKKYKVWTFDVTEIEPARR